MGYSKSRYFAVDQESIVESGTDERILLEVQVAIEIDVVDKA
jgi:hypothetical protein